LAFVPLCVCRQTPGQFESEFQDFAPVLSGVQISHGRADTKTLRIYLPDYFRVQASSADKFGNFVKNSDIEQVTFDFSFIRSDYSRPQLNQRTDTQKEEPYHPLQEPL
jgi:hypothetical protein